MRFTMGERQKITAALAERYQRVRKKDKVLLLNEFIALATTFCLWGQEQGVRLAIMLIA